MSRYRAAGRSSMRASTTLANSTDCRCSSGSAGSASHLSTSDAPWSDHITPPFGSLAVLGGPRDRLAVSGQPGQRPVDLAEGHRLAAAEERVVVALEFVAMARLPLQQAEPRQGNTHTREHTLSVYPRKVIAESLSPGASLRGQHPGRGERGYRASISMTSGAGSVATGPASR